MQNKHGAQIIPAADDMRQAEEMLERERKTGTYKGKGRIIAALENRIAILKKREESERR